MLKNAQLDRNRSIKHYKYFLLSVVDISASSFMALNGWTLWDAVNCRPIVRDLVSNVITVTDDEIIAAAQLCFRVLKLAVEPSGAIGLAAVLSKKFKQLNLESKNVGIVLSGGNVDLGVLWEAWKSSSQHTR
jgi:threonine synthase